MSRVPTLVMETTTRMRVAITKKKSRNLRISKWLAEARRTKARK